MAPGPRTARALLAAMLAVVAINLFAHITEELRDYGDPGGEAAALMASRHFVDKGFVAMRFLPVHNNGSGSLEELAYWVYARYPPLPDLIVGAIRSAFGGEALWPLRVLPVALNLAAIALLYALVNLLLGRPMLAFAVAAAYALNFSFMKMADSFHYFGYAEFFRVAIPYAAVRWAGASAPNSRRAWLALLLATSFVNVWITFDYIVHACVLAALVGAFFLADQGGARARLRAGMRLALPVALASGAAFALRIVHNGWYYGSMWKAAEQFGLQALYRIFNLHIETRAVVQPLDLHAVYATVLGRIEYSFGLTGGWRLWLPLAATVALALLLVIRRRDSLYQRFSLLLLAMALANFSYVLLLPQWALHHFGLGGIRHILPTYALIAGGGLYFAFREIAELRAVRGPGWRTAPAFACLVIILAGFGYLLTWNARDVARHWRASENETWAVRFAYMDRAAALTPRDAFVMGNAFWRPEPRYRFNRQVELVENLAVAREAWPAVAPGVPRYFAFFERWGDGDDGFFPNYTASQADLQRASRRLLSWLDANAEFQGSSGRWRVYRMPRPPADSEVGPEDWKR